MKGTSLSAAGLGMFPFQYANPFSFRSPTDPPFSGIQIAAHSFYDEGMEPCLDLLQETGAINTLLVSFHSYYGAIGRPSHLMGDHGFPKPDNTKRNLRRNWVEHHEKFYSGTSLRHIEPEKEETYSGKDIMHDLLPAAHERGMKVYERLYEPQGLRHGEQVEQLVRNFGSALEINFEGEINPAPCLNHPGYRNWLTGTVRDLFSTYDLDGIQFGAERCGPLGYMLHWDVKPTACFCRYCRQQMEGLNIDPERLRKGFSELYGYLRELRSADAPPPGGAWHIFLRHLMQYPEIMSWSWQWHRTQNEVHQLVHDAIKEINPQARVGRHVSCVETAMDMFYRAGAPFEEMTANCDFIKVILYHEINGPRLAGRYLNALGDTIYKGIPHELILQMFYALYGHDASKNPDLKDLERLGLSPDFVFSETRRVVAETKGGGWGTEPWHSRPETIYEAVIKAFEAGARGVVASREYEEMTLPSLKAYGDGVREMSA